MKSYNGVVYAGSNQSVISQLFYQIDEYHCVGLTDKCVYQIIPLSRLFLYEDKDGNINYEDPTFIGDFDPIATYIDFNENVCLNYAEDGKVYDYLKPKFDNMIGIDEIYDDNFIMNMLQKFNNSEHKKDYPSVDEMRVISADRINKL